MDDSNDQNNNKNELNQDLINALKGAQEAFLKNNQTNTNIQNYTYESFLKNNQNLKFPKDNFIEIFNHLRVNGCWKSEGSTSKQIIKDYCGRDSRRDKVFDAQFLQYYLMEECDEIKDIKQLNSKIDSSFLKCSSDSKVIFYKND